MKFLIIQTAFLGDAILATALIEKLNDYFPKSNIDFLVKKGTESLFKNHPKINQLLVFNKSNNKYVNLWKLIKIIRAEKYDKVINLQRFATTGMITVFSGSKEKIGFDKNPFSFLFSQVVKHSFTEGIHEVDRNQQLIASFTDFKASQPKLYPTSEDYNRVSIYKSQQYIYIAPASAWFTKQYPNEKWIEFINQIPDHLIIYLDGGKGDVALCEIIKAGAQNNNIKILAGKLSLLESAALMKDAMMNYVNDSSPMHLASSVNAPTCAIYCSTTPEFGFYPLSTKSFIIEIEENLYCRPCGTHGHKKCPEGHFNCAKLIQVEQLNVY